MNKSLRWGIAILCLALTVAGCGYSTRSVMAGSRKTIYIAPFKNKILYSTEAERNNYFSLLEVKVTTSIVDRFLFDGNLRVAKEDTADWTLKGELLGYQRDPLRYVDNTEEVQEYRLRIIVSLQLWDNADQKLLWQEPSFAGEATYFTTGPLAKTESTAVEETLVDLARRVVERTIEDW